MGTQTPLLASYFRNKTPKEAPQTPFFGFITSRRSRRLYRRYHNSGSRGRHYCFGCGSYSLSVECCRPRTGGCRRRCILVQYDRRFRGHFCLFHAGSPFLFHFRNGKAYIEVTRWTIIGADITLAWNSHRKSVVDLFRYHYLHRLYGFRHTRSLAGTAGVADDPARAGTSAAGFAHLRSVHGVSGSSTVRAGRYLASAWIFGSCTLTCCALFHVSDLNPFVSARVGSFQIDFNIHEDVPSKLGSTTKEILSTCKRNSVVRTKYSIVRGSLPRLGMDGAHVSIVSGAVIRFGACLDILTSTGSGARRYPLTLAVAWPRTRAHRSLKNGFIYPESLRVGNAGTTGCCCRSICGTA